MDENSSAAGSVGSAHLQSDAAENAKELNTKPTMVSKVINFDFVERKARFIDARLIVVICQIISTEAKAVNRLFLFQD